MISRRTPRKFLFSSRDILPCFIRDEEDSELTRLQLGCSRLQACMTNISNSIAVCVKDFFSCAAARTKKFLAPRIFSTVRGEINLPSALEEAHKDQAERNEDQPHTNRTGIDTSGDNRRSNVYRVNVREVAEALQLIENLFNTDDVMCALDMPEGRTRLVACPRKLGRDYQEMFLCSEFRVLDSLRRANVGDFGDVYFLCCNGFKKKIHVKDMLFTVADNVRKRRDCFGNITLAYPLEAKELLTGSLEEVDVKRKQEEMIGKICVDTVDSVSVVAHMVRNRFGIHTATRTRKPPVAFFHDNKISKILWHTGGRTVIKKEHKLLFTGTGVKVRRRSLIMWLSIIVGFALTIWYVAARSDATDFEELIQTALAIAALYAASIIPLTYYMFYAGENLVDVVTGRVHLDTRSEFDNLSEEERLYICLESLKLPSSDRMFIDRHHTSYATGTAAGAAMRVNYMPCIGNLLAIGFRYWEEGKRRGLVSPTRKILQLIQDGEDEMRCRLIEPDVPAETSLDFARSVVRVLDLPEMKPCPIEHYYVGLM